MRVVSLCIAGLLVGGCGAGAPAADVQGGLTLATYSETEISGVYRDAAVTLRFSAKQTSPQLLAVTVGTDRATIDVVIDNSIGEATFDGHQGSFDSETMAALKQLDLELSMMRRPEGQTSVEKALSGMAALLTEVDSGEQLPTLRKANERSWVNIGCGDYCRWLTCSCSACGGAGKEYYKQTGINSPNCKGRCGAGCGDARSGGYNTWTMDCAEHDYHLGPFGDCSDDVMFDGTTYRCSYTGEFCAGNCSCQPTGTGC